MEDSDWEQCCEILRAVREVGTECKPCDANVVGLGLDNEAAAQLQTVKIRLTHILASAAAIQRARHRGDFGGVPAGLHAYGGGLGKTA